MMMMMMVVVMMMMMMVVVMMMMMMVVVMMMMVVVMMMMMMMVMMMMMMVMMMMMMMMMGPIKVGYNNIEKDMSGHASGSPMLLTIGRLAVCCHLTPRRPSVVLTWKQSQLLGFSLSSQGS